GGKQGGVVLVAAIGRVAARRGHLRGTLRAGQERIGRLRVRTGGRVVQVVQVLAHHGVADEVRDTLVPVRHTDEAGGSEVPLHAEVEVVGLERQQRRGLGAAGGTELLAVEGRAARATRGRAGIQVAVRRAGDRLAERRTTLDVGSEVDAEVEVRQQVAVPGGLAE